MPNTLRGRITVKIGGRRHIVEYDWEAIANLIEAFGSDYDQKIAAASAKPDVDILAATLAIGLRKHHPDITAADVRAASPPIVPVAQAINYALTSAFHGRLPKEEDGEKTEPGPPVARMLNAVRAVWHSWTRSAGWPSGTA